MLISDASLSHLPPDLFEPALLKLSLISIPTNRTNFYFETKALQGFKSSLQDEIQDLLVELQACENHLQRIISIFLLFIQKYEKMLNEKDEKIFS